MKRLLSSADVMARYFAFAAIQRHEVPVSTYGIAVEIRIVFLRN